MSMLTSKTNPILADTRTARGNGYPYNNMLYAFNACTEAAGHYIALDWERVTNDEQINQARKVLTRLARLEAS